MSVHFLCQKFDVLLDFLHVFRNLTFTLDFLSQGHMACSDISYTIQKTAFYVDYIAKGDNHASRLLL